MPVSLDISVAILAALSAIVVIRMYYFLRTSFIIEIAGGFSLVSVSMVLSILTMYGIVNVTSAVATGFAAIGFVLIFTGSLGLLLYIQKTITGAAKLVREKGILPDTWKDLDLRVKRLKKQEDNAINNGKSEDKTK